MPSNAPSAPGSRPPRAEPLQPDRPGQGSDRQHDDAKRAADELQRSGRQQRKQSETAVENTREGYD